MRGYYTDWNVKNHDHGLDPIDWENCPPPKAVKMIKWLEENKPEIIEKMKKGIEPGFGKTFKAFLKSEKTN